MKFRITAIALLLVVSSINVFARVESDAKDEHSQKIERTIPAEPGVTVSICVMSGNINVRGWDRNEVLVRSSGPAEIELKRKDPGQTGPAAKVEVLVVEKHEARRFKDGCQSFSDLELSVPNAAAVHVQTRDGNISISEVGMAFAGTQNGDISISRVSRAVEVGSVSGSICVKDSTGRASVATIGGGIDVANMRPADPADLFEATSVSGDLTLDKVSHAQLNARTVSGNVNLSGALAKGGKYGFRTMSGDVTLSMPGNSSFNLSAKVSSDGEIITDFPLTLIPEDAPAPAPAPQPRSKKTPPTAPSGSVEPTPPTQPHPPEVKVVPQVKVTTPVKKVIVTAPAVSTYSLRRYNAICGSGDATINVASFTGTLRLQKED